MRPLKKNDFESFPYSPGNAAKSYFQSIVENAKKVSHLKKTTSGPFLYYLWQCSKILFPIYVRFKTKTRGPSEEIDFGPFHIAYGNAAKSYFQSIVEDAKKVSHLKKRLRVPL